MPNPLVRRKPGQTAKDASSVVLPPVLNIAHRGARAYAPENTVEAFLKGIDLFDCPAVELDVHLSKDGELIVVHDDDLRRCTPDAAKLFPKDAGSYWVSDYTLAELQTLDAGSWFVDQLKLPANKRQGFLQSLTDEEIALYIPPADQALYSSGKIRMPTLEQVFKAVFARSETVIVNVELKCLPRMYPQLTEKVIDLVVRLGVVDRVLLSSFDHAQVQIARNHLRQSLGNAYAIPVAALFADRPGKAVEYLDLIEADAYNPGSGGGYDIVGFNSVTGVLDAEGIMKGAIAAGMGVNVWTENDKVKMTAMIKAGIVTGIFNDYPNRMVEVLQELGMPTSSQLAKKGMSFVPDEGRASVAAALS